MNRNHLLIAFVFLVSTGTVIFAQRPAGQSIPRPAPPQTAAPQTGVQIPDGKIALIYSEDFRDPKSGIVRYVALMNSLSAEFQTPQKELNDLAQRIQQLTDDIEKTKKVAAPDATQRKVDQLEQMKKDYQRKGEDGQAAYKKRHDEVMAPLNLDIGKALEVYAKAHGITVIIDGNQVPLVYAADTIDITRAFISEFNSKNPATAAATPRE
jgi:Skp family chaperone for outer membrane proteins